MDLFDPFIHFFQGCFTGIGAIVWSPKWSSHEDLSNIGRHLNTTKQRTNRPHHDDVLKWKQFPRYWPFVRGIHRSPVNYLHKGQWRGVWMFSLIFVWINGWVNNRDSIMRRWGENHRSMARMSNYIPYIVMQVISSPCPNLSRVTKLFEAEWRIYASVD